jgi:hypothetical protein
MIQKTGHDYQHLYSMYKDPIHALRKTHLEFYHYKTNIHSPETNKIILKKNQTPFQSTKKYSKKSS